MKNTLTADTLRGHTDTMILKLLLTNDHYGYEIVKLIQQNSDFEYDLKEATMYSSLKRLENDKSIIWYWGEGLKGGRRKYYQITEHGKEIYQENKKNWEYSLKILKKLL